jgi:DNA polymerase-3 subunit gamma/tau
MYQPSHRKHRPKTFSAILGQDDLVITLKNALKLNRIAHAYLFCGSRGTGKTTVARLFAKALNCLKRGADQEPCNTCFSCTQMNEGRSLDIIEIDGASNRGIDDIRGVNETIGYATISSKYKIYIIDEVHMLTKEAFNALLKTLEEPPENVKFFFATTEPHKVLPTIISRCQRFDLNRIPSDQICKKLKMIAGELGLSIQEDVYELIAMQAEGGLRDAESLLDQLMCYSEGYITYENVIKILGLSPKSTFFKLDQAIYNQQFSFAFDLAKEIFSTGKDLACFIESLMEHFRLHLLYKLNIPISSYLSEEDKRSYLATSPFYTQEQCFYNLDFLMQWNKDLSKTPFKRISLEMILLHLIRNKNRVTLPILVRRLEQLESNSELSKQSIPSSDEEVSLKKEPIAIEEIIKPQPAPAIPYSEKTEDIAIEPYSPTSRHDVLLRFASVELEGTLVKE